MWWVSLFKKEMHTLHRDVLALVTEYIPNDARDQYSLNSLVGDVKDFCLWADILPENAEPWQWIGSRVVDSFDTSEKWLDRVLLIKFSLFMMFNGDRPNITPRVTELREQVTTALERIARILNDHLVSIPSPSQETPEQVLLPSMILTVLWPFVYPAMVNQPLSISDVHEWHAVHYHPYRTHHFIYRCVWILSRKRFAMKHVTPIRAPQTVFIQPHRTTNFFELRLSIPDQLMPAQWDMLMGSLSHELSNDLEYLRELGGDIMPLTWDDGHGQGVIVQLPWAKN